MNKTEKLTAHLAKAAQIKRTDSHTVEHLAAAQLRDFYLKGPLIPEHRALADKLISETARSLVVQHNITKELIESYPIRLCLSLSLRQEASLEVCYKIGERQGNNTFFINESEGICYLSEQLASALATDLFSHQYVGGETKTKSTRK